MLHWANTFNHCCFFDNNLYASPLQQHECLVGAGVQHAISAPAGSALQQLQAFLHRHRHQWMFGHCGYGLQAELGGPPSAHPNRQGFADLSFFVPQVVVQLGAESIQIICTQPQSATSPAQHWLHIQQQPVALAPTLPTGKANAGPVTMVPRTSRHHYLEHVSSLLQHIARGNCYEINYCQEFFAENTAVEPLQLYQQLCAASPNPFSCYYKVQQAHLLCASPERYLLRTGNRLTSQPIKGTAARAGAPLADEAARQALAQSPKEQAENVMVVDLVRNDLSRICQPGSVQVDELFGIYSYPQVHQMISTISGQLLPDLDLSHILRATFPMGSMTGAPKQRVLQLIHQYEQAHRGIFSGAVGYVQPNGNFDFNVVIRSLMYNA
ncbi:MAG: anthranilate synthase component I family protein, partial [Bacteroidetes bacterium]